MQYDLERKTYRCNRCEHKFNDLEVCPHCEAPLCPKCGGSGCIVNLIEMSRMVRHSAILNSQKKSTPRPRKAKDPNKRIQELMERTQ